MTDVTQAEMAARDERAHAEVACQCLRLAVVLLGILALPW